MAVADRILGRRIRHWTVLRSIAEPSILLCRCVCGRICAVSSLNLCRWQGKWGCGRRNSRYHNSGPPPNLIIALPPVGHRFGHLTVLDFGKRRFHWLCRCSCGKEKEVHRDHLRSGVSRSRGCLRAESMLRARLRNAEQCFQAKYAGRRFGHLTILKRVVSHS
jgi:hypothetical protein